MEVIVNFFNAVIFDQEKCINISKIKENRAQRLSFGTCLCKSHVQINGVTLENCQFAIIWDLPEHDTKVQV